jgi:hypothetical protein
LIEKNEWNPDPTDANNWYKMDSRYNPVRMQADGVSTKTIKYKEGMTLEEVETALLSVNLPQSDNGSELDRLRAALTKANSEAADYKKQLRTKQTEDEAKAAQDEEDRRQLQEAYDKLLKESNTSKHKASFLALGYDDKTAQEAAVAMVEGDTAKLFSIQKSHQDALETKYKSDKMHNMGDPASGQPAKMSKDDIMKITDATERQAAIAANLENFD